ncbi:hypothetical protein PR202_ga20770 [Eleusine coracana subsp. coracana]|uniref:Uncharacterized protein n=1 Tax=Eleusine coracana subsp. coracana TaxID=191504 RepID=A0AAV5CZN3_ELECO|nr:hypothetical protein PR202_ga20770 [Eleusine coracana subsp. coracana]
MAGSKGQEEAVLLRLRLSRARWWARPDTPAPLWKMEDERGGGGGRDSISMTSGRLCVGDHDTGAEGPRRAIGT